MLSVIFATGLLFVLIIGCVVAYLDVRAEVDHQSMVAEYEGRLDRLWDDEDDPEWAVEARVGIRQLPEIAS